MEIKKLFNKRRKPYMTGEEFTPNPWTRNPHLQTFLKSQKWLIMGKNPMVECAEEMIIHGGDGARLQGYYSPQPTDTGKGLILLLHGWEGGAGSAYMLHTGRHFFNEGHAIFRLNMRDHGDSHHLNEGIFRGDLIGEVYTATQDIAGLASGRPFYIVGFSMGGNFALRIALRQNVSPIHNLRHVFSISPVLDPLTSTAELDRGNSFYRNYFLKKWLRSLKKKQATFPHIYRYDEIFTMKSVMEITDYIIPRYSPFRDHREYFSTYTLQGSLFMDLCVPVTIITAEDDPVVHVRDFHELRGNENLVLSIQRYGGHCGFIDPFPFGCWYERQISDIIKKQ